MSDRAQVNILVPKVWKDRMSAEAESQGYISFTSFIVAAVNAFAGKETVREVGRMSSQEREKVERERKFWPSGWPRYLACAYNRYVGDALTDGHMETCHLFTHDPAEAHPNWSNLDMALEELKGMSEEGVRAYAARWGIPTKP